MSNIILIGFKNSGKTSVGKLLAKKLNKIFIDTDNLITQEYKIKNNILLSCREISLKHGEDYFRLLEKNIIASGGGTILYPDNIKNLKKLGKLIYLSAPYQALKTRTLSQTILPSYLNSAEPEKSFEGIYKQRQNIYSTIADLEIFTENKSINMIAQEIVKYIESLI